jgi:hypothetical protein
MSPRVSSAPEHDARLTPPIVFNRSDRRLKNCVSSRRRTPWAPGRFMGAARMDRSRMSTAAALMHGPSWVAPSCISLPSSLYRPWYSGMKPSNLSLERKLCSIALTPLRLGPRWEEACRTSGPGSMATEASLVRGGGDAGEGGGVVSSGALDSPPPRSSVSRPLASTSWELRPCGRHGLRGGSGRKGGTVQRRGRRWYTRGRGEDRCRCT